MILKLLLRNLQMVFRTVKSLVVRPFMLIGYRLRSLLNLSRQLNKIPKLFAKLIAGLRVKPEKRADFVDAGPVFIAKSLLVILLILAVALPLLIYFFFWPWLVSLFFTASFHVGQPIIEDYTGRVRIYHEAAHDNVKFEGRLEKGKSQGPGFLLYVNGMPQYKGDFLNGSYEGIGVLGTEDGTKQYEGQFKAGLYEGKGLLALTDGTRYDGDFIAGKRTGQGRLLAGETLLYDGAWLDDRREGSGTGYDKEGRLYYRGLYAADQPDGNGMLYHPNGQKAYEGAVKAGVAEGQGTEFDEQGRKAYVGSFSKGLYSGDGIRYDETGLAVYTGTFLNGLYDGKGKLVFVKDLSWFEGGFTAGRASGAGKLFDDGVPLYEGDFADGRMSGLGTLTHRDSGVVFAGQFETGTIAYGALFALAAEDLYAAFPEGLAEDTSDAKAFWLYNQAFGLAMRFSYAGTETPVKLEAVYAVRTPDGPESPGPEGALLLPGGGASAESGAGTPDVRLTGFLGLKPAMTSFTASRYEGYDIRLWKGEIVDAAVLLEYLPSEATAADVGASSDGAAGAAGGIGPGGAAAADAQAQAEKEALVRACFADLGLDLEDFASLGY